MYVLHQAVHVSFVVVALKYLCRVFSFVGVAHTYAYVPISYEYVALSYVCTT